MIKFFFQKNTQIENLILIADIQALSLISKITDIDLKSIAEYKTTKKGDINYIVFSGIFKESNINVLYVLVNDEINQDDLSKLAIRISYLKKDYIYHVLRKTSSSSLKVAKESYKTESIINETQCAIYFNQILSKAIKLNTSDIHISARHNEASVRMRVNGDLIEVGHYTYDDMLRIISSAYNKFASKDSKDEHFDVKETHETSIKKIMNGKTYNLRFISKPITPAGSFNITIRVINESFAIDINKLGYTPSQINILKRSINSPNGLIVLAGQVGSGKSLTIQSIANYYIEKATINDNLTKKLVTFESPVEYPIAGAEQIEYKRNPKNTAEQERQNLESQIQSLLRMDSDACVLQEIRSKNTASLAVELVESNNLVFTTVHAQSGLKIFNRFKGLGIDLDVMTEPHFLLALAYQTLIKTPCVKCSLRLNHEHNDIKERLMEMINRYSLKASLLDNVRIININGCKCCKLGVSGRTIIAELIEPNLDILEAFKKK